MIRLFARSLLLLGLTMSGLRAETSVVWIGMSKPTHGEREGIYRAELDDKTGALTTPVLAAQIGVPEFLSLHPNGKVLYAACQLADGKPGVAAFAISDDKKSLRPMGTQPTGDGGACHLATDRTGKCLFTAQYGTATVAAFPLAADGSIRPRSALVRHEGSGPNKARQEGPHPHWVGVDPTNRFLFVPDLGSDRVVIYALDLEKGTLTPHGYGDCPPGSGPRHFVFHPSGKFAFVVNELGVSVTAFSWDAANGKLTPIETVEFAPQEKRKSLWTSAEICIRPEGDYLYTSLRGHDSVAAFRIDPASGKVSLVDREPIRGAHPRNVELSPNAKWLLAAGRDSNTIAVFRVDAKTGALAYAEKLVNAPAPICIVMQPAP